MSLLFVLAWKTWTDKLDVSVHTHKYACITMHCKKYNVVLKETCRNIIEGEDFVRLGKVQQPEGIMC